MPPTACGSVAGLAEHGDLDRQWPISSRLRLPWQLELLVHARVDDAVGVQYLQAAVRSEQLVHARPVGRLEGQMAAL